MECLKDRHASAGGLFSNMFKAKSDGGPNTTATTNNLAAKLDIERLGRSFNLFAGSDDVMDTDEFNNFTEASNITRQQATSLWQILDKDSSGNVSKAEFLAAIAELQAARAWLRYCPDCIYTNTCAYCQECNANCSDCNESSFCARCWADHPAKHRSQDDEQESVRASRLGASDLLRTHLLIRPLNWAYSSPFMSWVPVKQKALLMIRRILSKA